MSLFIALVFLQYLLARGRIGSPADAKFLDARGCMLNHFSRVTLVNPMDCSPPGFSVCGILQARILEWVAMPSSRGLTVMYLDKY